MRLRHSAVSGVGCTVCSSSQDSGKVRLRGTGEVAVVLETGAEHCQPLSAV